MRHSFRLKIALFLTIAITLTIVLYWTLNRSFLQSYYVYSKKLVLTDAYNELQSYLSDYYESEMDEEHVAQIDKMEVDYNVKIYLTNEWVMTSFLGTSYDTYIIYPWLVRLGNKGNIAANGNEVRESARINDSIQAYTYPVFNTPGIDDVKVLESYDYYGIYSQHDEILGSSYIDLYGTLDNGYGVFVRANLESIQESVNISNQFLAYIGIVTILLGSLIAYLFTSRFTKPIISLSSIAKRMSELDFDVKYKITSKDEIGELGNSINNLSERLERTISELKTANTELKTDIERKVEIDEMRKDFLSNVTHELKTPIALIQGYAEGLKDNISDDQESRDFYCDVIIDEAVKMNQMVKKLLSLNQIEHGNNQLEIQRFDICGLITSVLNATDILLKQKEITVHFEKKDPIFVWADEYMIEEVITNYVSNAINHADGAKIIEIKTIQKDDILRVAVFNTGEQIPEEDIDNVWIKFYKVDKARTREYGGNGIGLSIVKAIMDSHSMPYGVRNHETGVEFWIELDASNR